MTIKPPMSFEAFFTKGGSRLKEFSFLFGSGFPQSHPEPKVRECFRISGDEYEKLWEVVSLRVKLKLIKHSRNDEESLCPEKILNFRRMVYGIGVFRKYQEKQKELTLRNIQRPTEFLKKFGSVYTLNYDYFSYVSIFSNESVNEFKDGIYNFEDNNLSEFTAPLEFDKIKNCLENSQNNLIPFYFLHGAFHIIQDENGKYRKVKGSSSRTFTQNVKAIYEFIDLGLESFSSVPDKVKLPDPVLVFSGRAPYKSAALEDDKYPSLLPKKAFRRKKGLYVWLLI